MEVQVMTVRGQMPAAEMGLTLPHEHVLVDFIGAAEISRERYDRNEVKGTALPYLKQARELGAVTFVDCTPEYIGRDPLLLRQLAELSAQPSSDAQQRLTAALDGLEKAARTLDERSQMQGTVIT